MDKSLTIKVNEELYRKIKIDVLMRNMSLKEYLLSLIMKDLKERKLA